MHVRLMPLSDGGGSLRVKYRSVYGAPQQEDISITYRWQDVTSARSITVAALALFLTPRGTTIGRHRKRLKSKYSIYRVIVLLRPTLEIIPVILVLGSQTDPYAPPHPFRGCCNVPIMPLFQRPLLELHLSVNKSDCRTRRTMQGQLKLRVVPFFDLGLIVDSQVVLVPKP